MPIDRTDASPASGFDWSASALGDPARWPHCLRRTVDIMLASPLAALLMWGPEQIMVFNEAYVALLGPPHWRAPGGQVPALRPAAWSWSAAVLEAAWAGKASLHRDQALTVWRGGAPARQALDLCYTPVCDELARVRGILCSLYPGAAAPKPPLRILVVEDQPDARYLVCETLRAFGHSAQAAASGEQAAALAAAQRFDLLFTDIGLPGMSGIELARRLLRREPGLRIIVASGCDEALTRRLEFAATVLQKPYDIEQLQQALDQARPGGVGNGAN